MPCSQNNFTLARYKQELTKLYSNVDLYVCKEADFKADGEMNDRGLRIGKAFNRRTLRRWQHSQSISVWYCTPFTCRWLSLFPSESGSSITKLQVTSNLLWPLLWWWNYSTCEFMHWKCAEVSFLGFMETSPAIEIPDISDEEISSMHETNKALLPLCDMLRPLIAKL